MMLGVLQSNRENVLNALFLFREALKEIETAIQIEDTLKLENILDESQQAYKTLLNTDN